MRNEQAAREKPADAQGAGEEPRAREREGGDGRGENWMPDWDGWLAGKKALRDAALSGRAAPPLSTGRGRQGKTQQGSGSAGSGR